MRRFGPYDLLERRRLVVAAAKKWNDSFFSSRIGANEKAEVELRQRIVDLARLEKEESGE